MKIIGNVDSNTYIVSVDIGELAKIAGLSPREFRASGPLVNGDTIAVAGLWDQLRAVRENLHTVDLLIAGLHSASVDLSEVKANLPAAYLADPV